jgi:hypothetical protein
MKKYYVIWACAVFAAIFLLMMVFIPSSTAQNANSQDFSPSRYVVVAADINVLSPQMGNSGKIQSVMLKLDTVTGKSWILQVHVMGGNDPKVRYSSWHEVGFVRKNIN